MHGPCILDETPRGPDPPGTSRLLAITLLAAAGAARAEDGVAFFEARVRPVLVERCYTCHGADKQKGGLRLDSRDALRKGGDSGPAVAPGTPDAHGPVPAD